jgi:hypothetical protein
MPVWKWRAPRGTVSDAPGRLGQPFIAAVSLDMEVAEPRVLPRARLGVVLPPQSVGAEQPKRLLPPARRALPRARSLARGASQLAARYFRGRFRASYAAMWSEILGAVESELTPCDRPLGAHAAGEEHDESVERVLSSLGHDIYLGKDHDPDKRVRFEVGDDVEVSIGPASDAWVVRNLTLDETDDGDLEVRRALTLKIEGVELPDQEHAEEALERAGNAALFELDRALGVGLRLRTRAWGTRERGDVSGDLPARLALEYDREPMSLYWYARTAQEGMPLLAFLAYYQSSSSTSPGTRAGERCRHCGTRFGGCPSTTCATPTWRRSWTP